jgi:hypothetical protein
MNNPPPPFFFWIGTSLPPPAPSYLLKTIQCANMDSFVPNKFLHVIYPDLEDGKDASLFLLLLSGQKL